jgi:hypothetical protein
MAHRTSLDIFDLTMTDYKCAVSGLTYSIEISGKLFKRN